jgi:hypothetical protein
MLLLLPPALRFHTLTTSDRSLALVKIVRTDLSQRYGSAFSLHGICTGSYSGRVRASMMTS